MISVGGGLPVQPENHLLLQQLGTVIYLQIFGDSETEACREYRAAIVKKAGSGGADPELMDQREEIYQEVADLFVDTDGKTFRELISEIENRLEYR